MHRVLSGQVFALGSLLVVGKSTVVAPGGVGVLAATGRRGLSVAAAPPPPGASATSDAGDVLTPGKFCPGSQQLTSFRDKKLFYVDKTKFIADFIQYEGEYSKLFRPPRMGKTLMLDAIHRFCDINTTDAEFDKLFGGTDVAKIAETSDMVKDAKQGYHVLRLNLAFEEAGTEDILKGDIFRLVAREVRSLPVLGHLVDIDRCRTVNDLIGDLCLAVKREKGKLLVLIDEYDRALNKVADNRLELKPELMDGLSPLLGSLKSVQDIPIKVLMTGLVPLAGVGLSSANMWGELPFASSTFGDAFGFTAADIRAGFKKAGLPDDDINGAVEVMTKWFNGYLYGGSAPLYNPFLSLTFMQRFIGMAPDERREVCLQSDSYASEAYMNNDNVKIPQAAIALLLNCPAAPAILPDLLPPGSSVDMTGRPGPVSYESLTTWGKGEVGGNDKQRHELLSYLYHIGALTLAGPVRRVGPCRLRIPNEIIRRKYWQVFEAITSIGDNVYRDLDACFRAAPDVPPEKLANVFQVLFDGTHTRGYIDPDKLDESGFRAMLLGMEKNPSVKVKVEVAATKGKPTSTEPAGRGRIDLIIDHVEYKKRFVVELKREKIKRKIENTDDDNRSIAASLEAAVKQVESYDKPRHPLPDGFTDVVKFAAILDADNKVHVALGTSSTLPH